MTTKTFNPLSADYQQNPYEAYKYLREQRVLFVPELNSWWVGRYEDVRGIANQPGVFSNEKFHEISLGEFDYAPEAESLVASDPPIHTRLRRLVNPAFRPARLLSLAEKIKKIIDSKIDPLVTPGHTFDFQHDFSELIPLDVIALFMNTDLSRVQDFRRWSSTMLSASQRASMTPAQHDNIRLAIRESRAYFLALIAERRKNPGDDVISDFVRAADAGDSLTDEEILSLAILLLNGGNETTAHLLGSVMAVLWDHPEQFEIIKNNPARIPDAIDEVLRYEAPVQTVFLWTMREVEVGGVTIPKDAAVIGCWGSANRDERQFKDPDTFNIDREKRGHMAFGFGPHFCLGNMLGRQEVIASLARVMERMPTLRRATTGPIEWLPSYWVRGPRTLMVTV
ncbi:MAG: cytochrome [Hydrocarboniphaga sp.]|uniref:cytochrome P450 n=1 Tax=Hydrocarboniphaga sp. TaxID=2033016 RepID=UPI00262DFE78|nr:cytochrome P450 [Hydrocarboniphaga sp.]MDB5970027.1 cytochrome [Hydrocarboniphaga sp.]